MSDFPLNRHNGSGDPGFWQMRRTVQGHIRKYLDRLKSEWMNGSAIIFRDDSNKEDHQAISRWILGLLDQETRSNDEELIVSLVYHSLNCDIPFKATASERAKLLQLVRAKINDASRK
jgi:hypothetical protein